MKVIARINYEWNDDRRGYLATFVEGPEGMSEPQAEAWIKTELDKTYGHKWKLDGSQYLHIESHAGMADVATLLNTYFTGEKHPQRINEINKNINHSLNQLTVTQPPSPAPCARLETKILSD